MPMLNTAPPPSASQQFLEDVWAGLSAPRKTLPCKYFYDDEGSALFEKICATDEYYVTRTEMAIFQHSATDMARFIGPQAQIIEPGAGALKKISLLLAALEAPAAYIPLDISADFLQRACRPLQRRFPELDICPLALDFSDTAALTEALFHSAAAPGQRVIFFPGSTIGNFAPAAAQAFLAGMAAALQPGDGLLIGVDLLKSASILEAAYDDAQGMTAAFNKNLLRRINTELGGELELDNFSHQALFNRQQSRVEMHLRSKRDHCARVAGRPFQFRGGETIHTENSYKYSVEGFTQLAGEAGFVAEGLWLDEEKLFSVHYMRRCE